MRDIQNDEDIKKLVHSFYSKVASSFSVRMEMEGKYNRSNDQNDHE